MATKKMTDQMIRQLQQGDSYAFDQLFICKHQQVYAYCIKLIKSEELAEEVMMDTFLTIWKKRKQLRTDQSVDALLFKVAKDLSFNCLKKTIRERTHQLKFQEQWSHPTYDPITTQMLTEEYERMINQAIDQLSPQRKAVFTMRRQLDMSPTEIAEQLGISKSTVKGHLAQAAKFFRKYFSTHTDISFVLILAAPFC